MPQYGIDYANTDKITAPGVAGFTKAKQAGARIIIPRAIFGGLTTTPFRDAYWARDKDAILAAGLKRSAYMFLTIPSKKYPDPPSVVEQVEAFLSYVGNDLKAPTLGSPPQNMVPFIDVEQDDDSELIDANGYYDRVLEACKLLRKFYGAWPGMYTSARVWKEELNNHPAGQLAACPLWLAKPWMWPTGQPVRYTGMPSKPITIPQFGNSWAIYQYAGDAYGWPGFSPGAVDTNTINVVGPGASGQWVMWIQARAGELTIDGQYGPKTKARIQKLQADYGLTADGIVGIDTITLLSWLTPAPL